MRMRDVGALCAAVGSMVAVPMLAQDAKGGASARAMVRQPLNGACKALLSASPELARSPEGMTLLRLKKEIDGVSTLLEQRGAEIEQIDVRKLNDTRRGVDSLMEVLVRIRGNDGSNGPAMMFRRHDSAGVMSGSMSRIVTDSAMSDRMLNGRLVFARHLEGAGADRPGFEVTLRDLASQFTIVARAGARAVRNASPSGYLGISLSGSQIRLITDSGSFTAHCDQPMVEAVDVGSPARRAGVETGDTVLAYNGRDITAQAVNYPQLLTPGAVVRIRVKRDGKARDIAVSVAERPAGLNDVLTGAGAEPRAGAVSSGVNREFSFRFAPSPDGRPIGSVTASASMVTVLGALLNTVEGEFAQRIGLEPGILVLRVQPGSPSAEAGLRPGEMIRAVNGVPVRELSAIQRAISMPNVHDVKLTVTGKDTPPRIVTVRW